MQEEKKDLATYAYEHIKQMVIDRELMPGERIQQEVLARELGISRTPLVTALNRLASENLVELEANKGFSVRRFSLKEIADIWSLRTAIERMVVEEIAARVSPEDVAYMRSIFAGLEPPWNQEKYAEYTRADRRFHNFILRLSDNSFVPQLTEMFDIVRWSYQDGLVRLPENTLHEHVAIIDALEGHDVRGAVELIVEHHTKSKECLEFALQQYSKLSKAVKF